MCRCDMLQPTAPHCSGPDLVRSVASIRCSAMSKSCVRFRPALPQDAIRAVDNVFETTIPFSTGIDKSPAPIRGFETCPWKRSKFSAINGLHERRVQSQCSANLFDMFLAVTSALQVDGDFVRGAAELVDPFEQRCITGRNIVGSAKKALRRRRLSTSPPHRDLRSFAVYAWPTMTFKPRCGFRSTTNC